MEGKRLAGRYDILQRVGGGGMAVVYKAKDLLLERYVAVKVMSESLMHDEEFIRRFIREVKASAALSHPNVVNVYDVNREGSIYYMTMEYVEGQSLYECIEQKGAFSPEESVSIVSQICDGLAHAHENGIIHRDIKPHNIMRLSNGRVKVTDFGISVLLNNPAITQTGMVMGSVHYISPEQTTGDPVGYFSDVYSLGILLYELVTGTVPFDGENFVSISLKHLEEPLPDPRKINPNIPERLCEIINQATEKDPSKRFQSVLEMKQALQQSITTGGRRRAVDGERKKQKKILVGLGSAIIVAVAFFVVQAIAGNDFAEDNSEEPLETHSLSEEETPSPSEDMDIIEGNHPWWRELPSAAEKDNETFYRYRVSGSDGKYEISVDVKDIPVSQFYYNIYVVDSFSSRLVLKGRSVSFRKEPGKEFTTVQFPVSLPQRLLPTEGIAKIEMYWMRENESTKADVMGDLLQMWGQPQF
ncbi:protein kinase domain-containing protein [Desmospora profundinema]|uniref:Serine/threonine protein kinase n=1 Tax=Desmospora profundinema TaxID=1571184 RepID=A0ABU1IR30_9BACL|nr:protein kinase [Desmospora profundinema]MDR6226878.1 serine/threonine protein kinase [Desmospora profundinema]